LEDGESLEVAVRSVRAIKLSGIPIALALLAGCAISPVPEDDTDPVPNDPGTVDSEDCIVGTWNLDVPAYSSESEEYVLGLGIPIEGFDMSGAGKLTFTADGLVAADVALTTTGTIVAGETRVPLSVPSTYTATGDWSRTDLEVLQFDNWAKVDETDDIPPEVDIPSLDVTQLSNVEATCSADQLFLYAPGAPVGSTWLR